MDVQTETKANTSTDAIASLLAEWGHALWLFLNWHSCLQGKTGVPDQIAFTGELQKPGQKSGINWDS